MISPAELRSRAERWRPWRAYAAAHLLAGAADALAKPAPQRLRKAPRATQATGPCGLSTRANAFTLDRIATPIGAMLIVSDDDGQPACGGLSRLRRTDASPRCG